MSLLLVADDDTRLLGGQNLGLDFLLGGLGRAQLRLGDVLFLVAAVAGLAEDHAASAELRLLGRVVGLLLVLALVVTVGLLAALAAGLLALPLEPVLGRALLCCRRVRELAGLGVEFCLLLFGAGLWSAGGARTRAMGRTDVFLLLVHELQSLVLSSTTLLVHVELA